MIFEQCKVGRYFAWADRDPGIKSPVFLAVLKLLGASDFAHY